MIETRNIQPRYIPGHGYIPAPLPFAWEMIANNGEIRGHYKKCESGDLPIVQYDRPPAAPITSITQMAVVLNIWRTIVMISCNHFISNKPRTNPNRIATINNLVAESVLQIEHIFVKCDKNISSFLGVPYRPRAMHCTNGEFDLIRFF